MVEDSFLLSTSISDPTHITITIFIQIYKINLQDRWWNLVAQGAKTIEGRLFKDHHSRVKINSPFEIRNTDTGKIITGIIVNTTFYPTFESMLVNKGLKHVLPGITNLIDGINIYYSIPGYQLGERNYGVIAIELHVHSIK